MTTDTGRERLLAAAREELAAVGAAGISLRAIARRAGVSHALPKHHFADRSGLLTALAAEGFRDLRQALEHANKSRPTNQLAALGRAYLSAALAEPAVFDLMFRTDMLHADDPHLNEQRGAAYRLLVEGAQDSERSVMAWAFIHGLSLLLRDGALPPSSDRRNARRFANALIDSFTARL